MTPSEKRYRTRMERRLWRIELGIRLTAVFAFVAVGAAVVLLARAAEPETVEQNQGQVPAQEEPRDISPREENAPTEPLNADSEEDDEALNYLGEFTITHYCACEICCGEWADGITYTGTKATEGRTVAVDPEVIPYGSEIAVYYPDGRLGHYIAEDRGGAIKGNRLDVYLDSHEAALEAGIIKNAQVSIKK